MNLTKRLLLTASLAAVPALLAAQGQGGLDPATILKPLADQWTTYSGDYTGRRFSALTQINQATVKGLSLNWVAKLTAGPPAAGGGRGGGRGGGGRRSDIRLKQDIVPLGRLDNGLELYRFRYKGSDRTAYVGVMAQEVQQIEPSAVWRGADGYLRVNYDRLGLKFMTWKEWLALDR